MGFFRRGVGGRLPKLRRFFPPLALAHKCDIDVRWRVSFTALSSTVQLGELKQSDEEARTRTGLDGDRTNSGSDNWLTIDKPLQLLTARAGPEHPVRGPGVTVCWWAPVDPPPLVICAMCTHRAASGLHQVQGTQPTIHETPRQTSTMLNITSPHVSQLALTNICYVVSGSHDYKKSVACSNKPTELAPEGLMDHNFEGFGSLSWALEKTQCSLGLGDGNMMIKKKKKNLDAKRPCYPP